VGGRGYAAGRESGGLLSGRAGLCCWAVERWLLSGRGTPTLVTRELDKIDGCTVELPLWKIYKII
jgi:hypothetical protein